MGRRAGVGHNERGVSDSVSWAILTPLLLVTVLGLLQVGLWLHGRTVAGQAAMAGAERAALLGADDAAVRATAMGLAVDGGLTHASVDVNRDAEFVRVRVSGRMPTFFDLGQGQVTVDATRPVERAVRP